MKDRLTAIFIDCAGGLYLIHFYVRYSDGGVYCRLRSGSFLIHCGATLTSTFRNCRLRSGSFLIHYYLRNLLMHKEI